jgi:hypothetical protein
MRRRWLFAWGMSLALHFSLIFALGYIIEAWRSSPACADGTVDRRIGEPRDACAISLSLDEPTARRKPEKLPVEPTVVTPSVTDQKNVGPNANPGAVGNTNANSSPAPATAGNGRSAVVPLHGKIQKPDFTIVYVLDRSGSMGRDRKLAHAVATLKASLQQLSPEVRFQIVVYDSRAEVMRIGGSSDVIPATPANLAEAERQLDALMGEGSSRHLEGLRTGLGLRPDLLILLTDADELSAKDVQQIKKWNAKGTAIHAVVIGSADESARSLREIAGPTHVHFIPTPNLH